MAVNKALYIIRRYKDDTIGGMALCEYRILYYHQLPINQQRYAMFILTSYLKLYIPQVNKIL